MKSENSKNQAKLKKLVSKEDSLIQQIAQQRFSDHSNVIKTIAQEIWDRTGIPATKA